MTSDIRPTILKPVEGIQKAVLTVNIFFTIFIKYTKLLLRGRLSFGLYLRFIKRLLIFYFRLLHNRWIKVNDVYKLQLYLPGFPSRAFFQAIEKFLREGDPMPITVVYSITKACRFKCPHCYQRLDKGKDMPLEQLITMAREMQDIGVAMMDIEGGEPLLKFDRLIELVRAIDERTEVWVNTNGFGLTEDMARQMKEAGVFGVMVSVHNSDPELFDTFTGVEGSHEMAVRAMKLFNRVGITTAINCCVSEKLATTGGVENIMEIARDCGCSFVQMIHEKSAGNWVKRNGRFTGILIDKLREYHVLYNSDSRYRDYPSLSAQVFEESQEVFGCTAGGIDRFYVGHTGEVQPCEFLNVSFGNLQEEGFIPVFRRMQKYFRTPSLNWLCCTECQTIANEAEAMKKPIFPLPREITEKLVEKWDKGEETPLYKSFGLYE
ncbi:MAG: radical SAM protein [bacterium]|jgi:MoaA/NifB/PqqE/SkfB family radical SAM enzyme|nr:radical SAM protein [bacterium]